MTQAHRRPKAPGQVRQALVESAMRLALDQGLAALSVQAVATAAGVTKGGFFHHFSSKQALIDAVFAGLLDGIDGEIDALMAADPEPQGRFTRAYVESVFLLDLEGGERPWACLSIAMLTDPQLRELWALWLERRMERHRATDAGVALEAVRLAADGLWLADLTGLPLRHRPQLREQLLAMTLAGRGRS